MDFLGIVVISVAIVAVAWLLRNRKITVRVEIPDIPPVVLHTHVIDDVPRETPAILSSDEKKEPKEKTIRRARLHTPETWDE